MGTSSSSQALVIPSITCENCHMMCGFSGLPKFRQFVAPTGVAPAQATLRAASATACIAPSRGSRLHQRPLPSSAIASPRSFDSIGLHHVVILLPDPALRADIRTPQQALEIPSEVAALENRLLG